MPSRMPVRRSAATTDSLPPLPFFSTPEQRVALARERFFEEGVRPSGLVPEPVIQSWSRCVGAHREPGEMVGFDPLTKTRISSALQRHHMLLEVAREDLSQLDAALAGTPVKAILTSHDGVIVHATPIESGEGMLLPTIARVGVNIGELNVGTGAPGVAARTGEVCVVRGGEHFFSCLSPLYCAAAPIRDARGDIAAVLDLTSEAEMFRFDAAAMVKLYATAIENHLLAAQARTQLLLRFQANPKLLHTPLEGLAAVGGDGRVAWVNGSGASLLGCARMPGWDMTSEALFGLGVEGLLGLAHEGGTRVHRMPSGLSLWLQAHAPERGAMAMRPDPLSAVSAETTADEPATQLPATLYDANRSLIERTLEECRGNVSRAARRLGVSRGLLYRRLEAWRRADDGVAD